MLDKDLVVSTILAKYYISSKFILRPDDTMRGLFFFNVCVKIRQLIYKGPVYLICFIVDNSYEYTLIVI